MAANKSKGKKKPQKFQFPFFRVLAWSAVLFLTGLTLFLALRLPDKPAKRLEQPPAGQTAKQEHPVEQRANATIKSEEDSPIDANDTAKPTYEAQADDFEAKTRNVDVALLHTLSKFGSSESNLRHRAVESREYSGQEFFYQNLTITLKRDVFEFLAELKLNLSKYEPEATLSTVNENPRDIEISILGQPTHHLFFPLSLTQEPEEETGKHGARLVIIIDDLGESTAVGNQLAALPFPVTFSVLPYNSKAKDVAKIARKAGRELLLHLPCEPTGYPKTANSGPGTLRANMSPAALEQTLVDNLNRLPDVDGVNNHMGSKLTASSKAMTVVLAHLKGQGKFFVDSMTTPKSVIREVSASLGMQYYRRQVFLDNKEQENAILMQLKKAQSLALRNGSAIAIGHPYPATLKALERWEKIRDKRVVICKIQDI